MKFSHLNDDGKARMVDIGGKPVQRRQATAAAHIRLCPETIALIRENQIRKGDVLAVARVAAIAGAKRTAELIPLCHNIPIDHVEVQFTVGDSGIEIIAAASTEAKTGIEMEALNAAAIAALTIYDMCKAVDKQMIIGDLRLLSKEKHDLHG